MGLSLEMGVKTPTYGVSNNNDPYPDTPTITLLPRDTSGEKQRAGARMELNAKARETLGLKGKKVAKGETEMIMPARDYDDEKNLTGVALLNSASFIDTLDDTERSRLIRFGKNSVMSNKPLYELVLDFLGKTAESTDENIVCELSIEEDENFGTVAVIRGNVLSDQEPDAENQDQSAEEPVAEMPEPAQMLEPAQVSEEYAD